MDLHRLAMLCAGALLAACAGGQPRSSDAPAADVAALTQAAEARYAAGDWVAAAEAYQRLAGAQPDSAETWFRLANARARADDPVRAMAAYREALARDANYTKAGFNLGMVQLRDAAEAFRRIEAQADAEPALRAQATQLRAGIERLLASPQPPAPRAAPADDAAR